MVQFIIFCFGLFFSSTFATDLEVKVGMPRISDNENEIIDIELTKFDAEDEQNPHTDQLLVQLRIHLVSGQVHLNGRPIPHGGVNSLHLHLLIMKVENGVKQKPAMLPVNIRVMVVEEVGRNNVKVLYVEEEFVSVEDYKVKQVTVHKVSWRNMTKSPLERFSLEKSKIHQQPTDQDEHLYLDDELAPHYDDNGYGYEEDEVNKFKSESLHCRQLCYIQYWQHNGSHHHDNDHHKHDHRSSKCHKFRKFKCWYHCLSTEAKVAIFSVSFLALLTLVLFCAICEKKRRHSRALKVTAQPPIDDNVDVQKPDEKASDDAFNFHFQYDNKVVVDDTAKLIKDEEA